MFKQDKLNESAPFGFKPVSTTLGQTLSSEITEGIKSGPTNLFNRSIEYPLENYLAGQGYINQGPLMNKAQWQNNGYNVPGVNFNNISTSDGFVSERVAFQAANRAKSLLNSNAVLSNSVHSIAKFAGGAAGFFADPLNIISTAAGGAVIDTVAPLAVNAINDISGGVLASTAENPGIPGYLMRAAAKHGSTGALAMGAQATANALNLNNVNDSTRALAAFDTLKQGFIFGSLFGIAGDGVGKVSKNLSEQLRPKNAEGVNVLDTSSHIRLQQSAVSQAVQGVLPDVTDAFKQSYNLARLKSEQTLPENGSPELDDLIANVQNEVPNLVKPNKQDILPDDTVSNLENELVDLNAQHDVIENYPVSSNKAHPLKGIIDDLGNSNDSEFEDNVNNKLNNIESRQNEIVDQLQRHESALFAQEELGRLNDMQNGDLDVNLYLGDFRARMHMLGQNFDSNITNLYNLRAMRDIANTPRLSFNPDFLNENFNRQYNQPSELQLAYDPATQKEHEDLLKNLPDDNDLNLAKADNEFNEWEQVSPENEFNQEAISAVKDGDRNHDLIVQGLDAAYKCLVS